MHKNKFKTKRNNFSQLDRSNYNSLVVKNNDYSDIVITFENHDGSKRVLNANEEFFKKEIGGNLRISEIIQKINTLKHDFNAKSYQIC